MQHQSESVYDKLRMFNGQSGGWVGWYPAAAVASGGSATPAHLALPTPTPTSITSLSAGSVSTNHSGGALSRDDLHKRGKYIRKNKI